VITVTDANPAAMRKSAPESGQFVEQRSQSSALSKRYKKIVILSGAETSRSEVSAEPKDLVFTPTGSWWNHLIATVTFVIVLRQEHPVSN